MRAPSRSAGAGADVGSTVGVEEFTAATTANVDVCADGEVEAATAGAILAAPDAFVVEMEVGRAAAVLFAFDTTGGTFPLVGATALCPCPCPVRVGVDVCTE